MLLPVTFFTSDYDICGNISYISLIHISSTLEIESWMHLVGVGEWALRSLERECTLKQSSR